MLEGLSFLAFSNKSIHDTIHIFLLLKRSNNIISGLKNHKSYILFQKFEFPHKIKKKKDKFYI